MRVPLRMLASEQPHFKLPVAMSKALGALALACSLGFVACNDLSQTPTEPYAPGSDSSQTSTTPYAPESSATTPLTYLSQPMRECSDRKTEICHRPPDNPDNVQEICISDQAVAAHLAHGDHLPFTFWEDSDGDGFGAGDAMTGCSVPDGFVENGDDCDDDDASINPAASEVCDGVDNNCNGQVDEGGVCVVECPCDTVFGEAISAWEGALGPLNGTFITIAPDDVDCIDDRLPDIFIITSSAAGPDGVGCSAQVRVSGTFLVNTLIPSTVQERTACVDVVQSLCAQ